LTINILVSYNISDNLKQPYQEWLRDGPDETRQPVACRHGANSRGAKASEDEASTLFPLALEAGFFVDLNQEEYES